MRIKRRKIQKEEHPRELEERHPKELEKKLQPMI
jgi:hypothetical protein